MLLIVFSRIQPADPLSMTDIGLVNSNTHLDNDKVKYIHFDYTLFSFEYNINSISHVTLNSGLKGETSLAN